MRKRNGNAHFVDAKQVVAGDTAARLREPQRFAACG